MMLHFPRWRVFKAHHLTQVTRKRELLEAEKLVSMRKIEFGIKVDIKVLIVIERNGYETRKVCLHVFVYFFGFDLAQNTIVVTSD